jgi:hypothetical protein|tara:strand:- start:168 stop:365 length:198 start_codon:yes stop_codon:yes gene_type:complete
MVGVLFDPSIEVTVCLSIIVYVEGFVNPYSEQIRKFLRRLLEYLRVKDIPEAKQLRLDLNVVHSL